MAINYETLINWPVPVARQAYTARDTILYALGLGLGQNDQQLDYVYEKRLKTLPTMGLVMGTPGAWFKESALGIDYLKLVNAGVSAVFHNPMPAEATVEGRTSVTQVIDKGAGRGAMIVATRALYDTNSGAHLVDVVSNYLCRGDGGFGGKNENSPPPHTIPDRAPDRSADFVTSPRSALIYRLSGDLNPLHADPEIAAKAGFKRPILHGLATFGIAGYLVISQFCDDDPARLKSLEARFSHPVTPGETICADLWRDGDTVSIRCQTAQGIVLNNGKAEIRA